MAWSYKIDTERDLVLITASGILTAAELTSGVATAIEDPRFHPDIRVFIDYHQVMQLLISAQTTEAMASIKVYSPKSRRAFYVTEGFAESVFGYYRTSVTAGQVQVFTDRAQALQWLNEGVPEERWLT